MYLTVNLMLVKFEIYHEGDYWCARGIGKDIFTQGKSLDELMSNLREAIEIHFKDLLEHGKEIRVLTLSEFGVGNLAETAGS